MTILNRQAYFNYHLLETFEAGLVLSGGEVKSVRAGQANLADSYVKIVGGEAWLHKLHIAPYSPASSTGRSSAGWSTKQQSYEPTRPRKLLLHKKELIQLTSKLQEQGLSLIPTKIYSTRNHIKVELALAKGKKKFDKRESLKRKETEREIARKMRVKR
ncbi:MAG: SsrA-binding protein SmpB [Patescibacteria group bacterium]|jgi:SsrA-binding protein